MLALERGELEELKTSARGCLAYILLADQMPRNIFRDTARAFAFDERALAATRHMIESGLLDELHPQEKAFALMPLMHAEDAEVQKLSVEMFDRLAAEGVDSGDFAKRHKEIIDRFGRYPHRNAILGRSSTPEEIEFLKLPGSSF